LFADELRAERARLGLSQQALSEALGIPKRTIENWEGGVNSPPPWAEKLLLEKLKQMTKRSE
jgi:DNA-binding transcriptional regulator YiaG